MIRRTALALAATAIVIGAGCTARTADAPGVYTEGGFGSRFYAEVSHAKNEGQKPRVYLFGKIADYDKFMATKEVPEASHKKFIGKGKNRETIVVQDLTGVELKDDPSYANRLVARYQDRHGLNGKAPVVESAAPAPVVAPAPAPAPAAAVETAPAAK